MPRVSACPDVRQAVLDAAQLLMERYGYKKMTIDDIASEVGIGKATIYGYFENKQEVGLAVIDHYHAAIESTWVSIDEQKITATEKLSQMMTSRVMYLFDVVQRYRQSLDECFASLRPLVLTRRDYYQERESKFLSRVIQQGIDEGDFVCGDPLEEAKTILTCAGGLMPLNLSPRELASREQVIEKTSRVIDLILRAIKADDRRNRRQTTLDEPDLELGLEPARQTIHH